MPRDTIKTDLLDEKTNNETNSSSNDVLAKLPAPILNQILSDLSFKEAYWLAIALKKISLIKKGGQFKETKNRIAAQISDKAIRRILQQSESNEFKKAHKIFQNLLNSTANKSELFHLFRMYMLLPAELQELMTAPNPAIATLQDMLDFDYQKERISATEYTVNQHPLNVLSVKNISILLDELHELCKRNMLVAAQHALKSVREIYARPFSVYRSRGMTGGSVDPCPNATFDELLAEHREHLNSRYQKNEFIAIAQRERFFASLPKILQEKFIDFSTQPQNADEYSYDHLPGMLLRKSFGHLSDHLWDILLSKPFFPNMDMICKQMPRGDVNAWFPRNDVMRLIESYLKEVASFQTPAIAAPVDHWLEHPRAGHYIGLMLLRYLWQETNYKALSFLNSMTNRPSLTKEISRLLDTTWKEIRKELSSAAKANLSPR